MKVTLILASALLLLLAALALPALDASRERVACPCAGVQGRSVEHGEASGALCRLVVEGGPETTVDRGAIARLGAGGELVGRYRYWEEPQGPTLYVYD